MALQSLWDGLSDHLIASIYPVDKEGKSIGEEVKAPLTEASLEHTANWQSPFESAGADSKAPMLMAMVQSGQIAPVLESLQNKFGTGGGATSVKTGESISGFFSDLEGKTGITKLNSTQIFSGMPPVKISITMLFKAFRDPKIEVERPYDQLFTWSLPKELADDGILSNVINASGKGAKSYLDALLPSKAPQLIGFTYKGETHSPMVIESISKPLNSPVDSNGCFTELLVPITLSTLTAIDQNDYKSVVSGKSF